MPAHIKSMRCSVRNCHQKAIGSLVHQYWDYSKGRRVFWKSGSLGCLIHLEEATQREIVAQLNLNELQLTLARRGIT